MTKKDELCESSEAMSRYFIYYSDGHYHATINSKLYRTLYDAQRDVIEWLNEPLFTEQFSKG